MDRRHRLGTVAVLGLIAGLSTGGCAEERYKVRLTPNEALDGAAGVDLMLLWATCGNVVEAGGVPDPNWIVARSQWREGEPAQDIGQVSPGRYALVAIVRGSDCGVLWAQCLDIQLERGEGKTIEVPLQQVGGYGCLAQEVCSGGLCTPAPPCDNVTTACDADGDSYPFCLEGHSPPECDCWDEDGSIHPGAEELCDGYDNDCNGEEDDNPDCQECLATCPEADACERPDCTTGECQLVNRQDGAPCDGDTGPALCCSGVCDGTCEPGDVQSRGCGQCGIQQRECGADCQWGTYGTCDESGTSECQPNAARDVPCGNCGTQHELCSETCEWQPDGACTGQGVCAPGAEAAPAACGDCGMRIDTCADDCTWTPGACEVDPDLSSSCLDPEICCPNGSCGEQGAQCCGTDTSTCGVPARCTDWTCDLGVCTATDEAAGTDPENECAGADCCDGAGACTSSCG